MPTNEILQFGTDGTVEGGDVLELADYQAAADRSGGVQPGIASRALFNTAMRQVSLMAAGLAEFIANRHEAGVVDDGDLAKIEAGLVEAIGAMITAAAPSQATTDATGVVELATEAEALAGTDATRAVTPVGLATKLAAVLISATTSAAGIVELATEAEVLTGTDTTRAVAPAGLAAKLAAVLISATTSAAGIVELATTTETTTGTDATRAVTPAGVAAALEALTYSDVDAAANNHTHATSLKSTRTTTGTWSLTGCTVGVPVFITVRMDSTTSGVFRYLVNSGSNGGTAGATTYRFGVIAGTNTNTTHTIVIIPSATTVSINVIEVSDVTAYAYY
jgi:hypothetical protein